MQGDTGTAALPLLLGSAGGAIYGGYLQKRAADMEAEQVKQQAEAEKLDAKIKANDIRREMLATLGAQDAALASRGVQVGQGTARTLTAETLGNFGQDLRMNSLNSLFARQGYAFQRSQLKLQGHAALINGFAQAAGMVANFGMSRAQLGDPNAARNTAAARKGYGMRKPVATRTGYGGTIGGGV